MTANTSILLTSLPPKKQFVAKARILIFDVYTSHSTTQIGRGVHPLDQLLGKGAYFRVKANALPSRQMFKLGLLSAASIQLINDRKVSDCGRCHITNSMTHPPPCNVGFRLSDCGQHRQPPYRCPGMQSANANAVKLSLTFR
jgi:hypothetical protein